MLTLRAHTMADHLLDGDKTLKFQKARKVVQCSKGTPQCEDAQLKFTVIREKDKIGNDPGEITVIYNPIDLANKISLRKKSGPKNTSKKVTLPCAMCGDPAICANGHPERNSPACHRVRAMDFLLAPDLANLSDEEFQAKRDGFTKKQFLQSDMNYACIEYMGGSENGLSLFYQAGNFKIDCRQPQVMKTGSLKAKVTVSMKIYWFTNNCERHEKIITSDRVFTLRSREFSIETLMGGDVGQNDTGKIATRYGYEYECPIMEAKLFCGTCFFEKVGDNPFLQPKCVDVDSGAYDLGDLSYYASGEKFYKDGKPYNPFAVVRDTRDEIAKEIEAKIPEVIKAAVQELIDQALQMSIDRSVDGQPVCALGYELDDNITINYTST